MGPVWWSGDNDFLDGAVGLFPVFTFSDSLNHIGPAWWNYSVELDADKKVVWKVDSWGLFPLADFGKFNNLGTVFWGYGEDGAMDYMVAFPLFAFGKGEEGAGMFLTLLGGTGWDTAGRTTFVNVLGPLYHQERRDESYSTHLLWPLISHYTSPTYQGLDVWPLFGRSTRMDSEGEPTEVATTALSGLFREAGLEETEVLRLLPLFSYRSAAGGGERFYEAASLFGFNADCDGGVSMHIGTPMLLCAHHDS